MEPNGGFQRPILMTDTQPQPQETNRPHDCAGVVPTTHVLSSPATLLASLPGALGFFPNEAVVLMHLRPLDADGAAEDCASAPTQYKVSNYQCADIGSASNIHDMLCDVPVHNRAFTFAVVVSRVPESMMVSVALDLLSSAYDDDGPLVDACWFVSEIADGTPYAMMFGPCPDHFDSVVDLGWGGAAECGTVSSVAASPSMRPLLENGLLPELDQSFVFEHFDPVSLADVARCDHLAARAHERGGELLDLTFVAPYLARPAIERACDLFITAPTVSLIDSEGSLLIDDIFSSDEDLELFAALLSRNRLRDCLIVDALANPNGAGAVLLSVARNFTGEIRANALSLWAMIAVSRNLPAWAGVALQRAEEEVPGHNLAGLLVKIMQIGRIKELLQAMSRGCRETWLELEE